ncbi:hypothetical protein A4X09_0g7790 [Tilletia walkeri]|uniref:JmjC domain-containing protein n=1 Tax=Tilletia walkeri TaxID=117179 RepID=A0A8X7N099_9BASI|nr:hypothetical protein A4X09_0g7790 [Tilletia walkeri]
MTDSDGLPHTCPAPVCDHKPVIKHSFAQHWRRHHHQLPYPLAKGQGFRSDRPTGVWSDIISSWSRIPSAHLHRELGLSVLLQLRDSPFSPSLGNTISSVFTTPPKFHHVLHDVEAALFSYNGLPGELYYFATGLPAPTLDAIHLHASVSAMNSLCLDFIDIGTLCFSAGVESHHSQGLSTCLPRVPEEATTFGIPSTGDQPKLETAYTPRGHITQVHVDGFWDGAILTCLFGTKLLLQWPSTIKNLEVLGQSWPISLTASLNIFSSLEDIKITLLKHGSFVYLPPGTFHAVMALDTSAMVAFGIKHPDMIEGSLKLTQWILDHLDNLPLKFDNNDLILEQLKDGAAMHCNVDHPLYASRNQQALKALSWVTQHL